MGTGDIEGTFTVMILSGALKARDRTIATLESEIASLRKSAEQERAFNAAILATIPVNRILSACENGNTAIQYFKDLHARATRAEAEAAALRKALEAIAADTTNHQTMVHIASSTLKSAERQP